MRIGLISLSILYVIQLVTKSSVKTRWTLRSCDLALVLGASIKEPGVEVF